MRQNPAADAFRKSPAIPLSAHWLNATSILVNELVEAYGPINLEESSKDTYQKALLLQAVRIRHHIAALSILTHDAENPKNHPYVDGGHAILKSLFELSVECALCLTYKEEFGVGPDGAGHYLHERIYRYAEFAKLRSLHQRFFCSQSIVSEFKKKENIDRLEESQRRYLLRGKDASEEELTQLAKIIQFEDTPFLKVNHWFPEHDGHKIYFHHRKKDRPHERATDVGSVLWRCKAVLAKHHPIDSQRNRWSLFYDDFYDTLNQRAHPSLGFDDVFRPESERIFDYAEQLTTFRIIFHECLLPMLCDAFSQWGTPRAQLMQDISELHAATTELVSHFEPTVLSNMAC